MRFTVVSSPSEIMEAMRVFELNIKMDTQVFDCYLGNQKGGEMHKVFWNKTTKLWCAIFHEYKEKFWCSYGIEDTIKTTNLNQIVQINPAKQNPDRRMGGVLIKDADGKIFLAHTGKIGGGKPGVGKSEFIKCFSTTSMSKVMWPDGEYSDVIVISRIDDEYLSENIEKFVKVVANFKKSV